MSLVIRFSRIGKRGERKYRIVVKEKRSKRDGKAVDMIGFYEKISGGTVSKNIDKSRYEYWVSKGAEPTAAVKGIL